jgi:hypothetical protein
MWTALQRVALFFGLAAAAVFLVLRVPLQLAQTLPAKRAAARLQIFAAGALFWPAVVLYLCGRGTCGVLVFLAALVILAYLTQEVHALSSYTGALQAYDSMGAFYQRAAQVSTAAFAMGTILVSQKDEQLAHSATPVVFLALALCVFSSVPSSGTQSRPNASASVLALQKLTVAYSAGILCLAVVFCLKDPAALHLG